MAMSKVTAEEKKVAGSINASMQAQRLMSGTSIIGFRLRFTAPIIMHAFSQKALEQMLAAQTGHVLEKLPKVPADEVERCIQRNTDGVVCLLPVHFKKAIASGAAGLDVAKGLKINSSLRVLGHGIPITYDEMVPGMDPCMVGGWRNRTADIRFRPYFHGARCSIVIGMPEKMTSDLLVSLVNKAGYGGIGDWRPQKGGDYGTFEVEDLIATQAEIDEVLKVCEPLVPKLRIPEWAMHIEIDAELAKRIADENRAGPQDD